MRLLDDRYELLEVIASGGMSSVWRAHDRRLDRPVAVKRPHPRPVGDDSWMRMSREARAAASLKHPNLVTVFDYGTDEEGPYLVMELIEGPTLHEMVGELSPGEAIDLGAKLADGLAAIHDAGIVHRDVKPLNVILSDHGPLLTDFGIALDSSQSTEITAPGHVVATPRYAAPEVLAGHQPTPASDVYSLAVMIGEMVQTEDGEPDRYVQGALQPALALSPVDRPSAESFSQALRRAAPTAGWDVPGGSTLVLQSHPAGPEDAGSEPANRRRSSWLWIAAVLGLLVGVAAIAAPLIATDPDGEEGNLASVQSTQVVPTTVPATTTTTTTVPTTSTPAAGVGETTDSLQAILSEPPRSDLKPSDVEDLMKKVDEAVEAAEDDNLDKAGEKLSEVAEKLEEKVSGERFDEAMTVLEALASLLSVELDPPDDDEND